MTRALFQDPDENSAGGPEPSYEWRHHGFTGTSARQWINFGFRVAEARHWREAGVYQPAEARSWRTAGVAAGDVRRWLAAGMAPGDAVRWHELGYRPADAIERHLAGEQPHPRRRLFNRKRHHQSPAWSAEQAETMRVMLRAGFDTSVAHAYASAGWRGAEACQWARAGIDPADARILNALDFTPADADHLLDGETDAFSAALRWWSAGCTPEEVVDWNRAGFTAAEAQAYRRAGITVNHARDPRTRS